MAEERIPEVGGVVVYHDPAGRPRNALVTAVWTKTCVNLVIVSNDEAMQDNYGRQVARLTSTNHKDVAGVHGQYWRFPDEEPNPYVEPLQK